MVLTTPENTKKLIFRTKELGKDYKSGDVTVYALRGINFEASSAHADYEELVGWLKNMTKAPSDLLLTHGEATAAEALQATITNRLGWDAVIARDLEEVTMG